MPVADQYCFPELGNEAFKEAQKGPLDKDDIDIRDASAVIEDLRKEKLVENGFVALLYWMAHAAHHWVRRREPR
eukprot:1256039-Amphidinium_carterae.1